MMNKITGDNSTSNEAFNAILKDHLAKAENIQYSKEELEEICEGLFILKCIKNPKTKSRMLKELIKKRVQRISKCR